MSEWDVRKQVSVFGDRFLWMSQIAKKQSLQFHIDRLLKLLDCDQALKGSFRCEPFLILEKAVYQLAM
jgi:hypothetical protein